MQCAGTPERWISLFYAQFIKGEKGDLELVHGSCQPRTYLKKTLMTLLNLFFGPLYLTHSHAHKDKTFFNAFVGWIIYLHVGGYTCIYLKYAWSVCCVAQSLMLQVAMMMMKWDCVSVFVDCRSLFVSRSLALYHLVVLFWQQQKL